MPRVACRHGLPSHDRISWGAARQAEKHASWCEQVHNDSCADALLTMAVRLCWEVKDATCVESVADTTAAKQA